MFHLREKRKYISDGTHEPRQRVGAVKAVTLMADALGEGLTFLCLPFLLWEMWGGSDSTGNDRVAE